MYEDTIIFSEELPLRGGKKAEAWAEGYLGQFNGKVVSKGHPDFAEQEKLRLLYGITTKEFYLDFNWSFEELRGSLWLYAGKWWSEDVVREAESANPKQVALFVQTYLKKFDPGSAWGFTWSRRAYKPGRPSGGGGAFVTAKAVKWVHAEEWSADKLKAFKATKKKKAAKRSGR